MPASASKFILKVLESPTNELSPWSQLRVVCLLTSYREVKFVAPAKASESINVIGLLLRTLNE